MQAVPHVPEIRVDGPMEGHGRNRIAEKVGHALVHDLAKYSENYAMWDRKRHKPKPVYVPGKMTVREYRNAMDSWHIQNSFSRRHPFLFVGGILAGIWFVKWLIGA